MSRSLLSWVRRNDTNDVYRSEPNSAVGGNESFAAGAHANANAHQCAVFSLWASSLPGMSCFNTNVFRIGVDHGFSVDYYSKRADGGGFRWVQISDLVANVTIATWTGAYLSDTGVWANNSDLKRKTDFQNIDAREVLAGVVKLPITRWRYIADSTEKRHIGPMAQDFWAAFGLGDDDTHIGTLDESGVALAAIQGLHEIVREKDARIVALEQRMMEVESLREELAILKNAIAEISQRKEALAQPTDVLMNKTAGLTIRAEMVASR